MQAEGVNVAAVPTTLLSNHPRYPTLRGRVLDVGYAFAEPAYLEGLSAPMLTY